MRVEIDGVHYTPITNDNRELAALRQERQDTVKLLRELCEDYGDNDWQDELHLVDIIDKHLRPYLPEPDEGEAIFNDKDIGE